MRCTERKLTPTALASSRPVQCVASPSGGPNAKATTRWTLSGESGALPGLRVFSRNSPSTPSAMNRACQVHTTGLALPERRMISAVPQPSAVARIILARHTCFCGALRSATIASSRRRSDLQDGGRPCAGKRRSFVLTAHHVTAGECAVEDRDRPTDGGAGGWVLRKLPARAVLDHARHRRYLRHGARPSAALAVQCPLRRALLSADPHL